jgi:hypothetical protein
MSCVRFEAAPCIFIFNAIDDMSRFLSNFAMASSVGLSRAFREGLPAFAVGGERVKAEQGKLGVDGTGVTM